MKCHSTKITRMFTIKILAVVWYMVWVNCRKFHVLEACPSTWWCWGEWSFKGQSWVRSRLVLALADWKGFTLILCNRLVRTRTDGHKASLAVPLAFCLTLSSLPLTSFSQCCDAATCDVEWVKAGVPFLKLPQLLAKETCFLFFFFFNLFSL